MPEQELEALAHQTGHRVASLAGALGLTPRQLERIFKGRFGIGPKRWIRMKRMILARNRLRTAESVKSVGWETGFKQPSHFSHEFRRYLGTSPSSLFDGENSVS